MEVPRLNNFLTVDEGIRPRANSDPTVATGSLLLPEITVEDCTDSDFPQHPTGDQGGLFGMDATPRRRCNTCPEDLFRKRNGRPPTPPPGTFRKGHRFQSGFTKPVMKESVSFTHHKLSKLAESEDSEEPQITSTVSADRLQDSKMERLQSKLKDVELGSGTSDRVTLPSKPSSQDSERSEKCGPLSQGDAGTSTENGSGSDNTGDSFVSQSSGKCRFTQTNSTPLDSKQVQAC